MKSSAEFDLIVDRAKELLRGGRITEETFEFLRDSGLSILGTGNTASVDSVTGATYNWTITNGTITAGATTTSITYTAAATGPVTLTVTVTASCGSSTTKNKTVTVNPLPTATISSGDQTVPPAASIQVALTGTAPWTIVWSDGHTDSNIASSPFTRTNVNPTQTTQYSITSVTDAFCAGTVQGGAVTITVATPPPAPAWLNATTQSANTNVLVQWASVSSAVSYRVERAPRLSEPWDCVPKVNNACVDTTQLSYTDSVVPSAAPVTYLYRVKAKNSQDLWSTPSPVDYATTASLLFTDEPLVANSTPIRGRYVGELRCAVDAIRYAAELAPKWANCGAATGLIWGTIFYDAQYVNNLPAASDLRNVLDEASLAIRGVRIGYTLPAPAPGVRIFAYQVEEIRQGVK